MVPSPLSGRRALVTGAATGIGRATAIRLGRDGASVAVNYIGDSDPAEEVVAQLEDGGSRAAAIQADVSVEDQVEALFAEAAGVLGGPVDLLVNNAGIEMPYLLVEMPLAEWERVLAVNLTGSFLCARAAARGLIAAGSPGVIVNITSVHEVIPWQKFSHYCASKAGLKLFGQSIARELAPHRVRVVQVAPGAVLTPINRALSEDPQLLREVVEQVPLGRLGEAEEIAAAIAWAAGPEASYVTGATIFVDGGMTLYPRFI